MKKKIILLISAISVLVCMSVHAFGFTDVSGGDIVLHSAIEDLCKFDIVDGYEDNTFRPDNLVTRAEMSEFCRRLLPPHVKSASGCPQKRIPACACAQAGQVCKKSY